MKTNKPLLPDITNITTFLQKQNFIIEFDSGNKNDLKSYTDTIEILMLLNKIEEKPKLSSQIYLAMIHQKFKKQIRLKSPADWQIKVLAFAGKILGFRI